MAAYNVAMVSISLLLLISSVSSVPVELIEPSDHGLANQKAPLAESPAMLTFFKGTQTNVELPEAIDSAAIARASHVTPETREESVSGGGSGRGQGKRNSAVVAGVVAGVVGLVVVVGAIAGFMVYNRRNEPGVGEGDAKALSLVRWNRGSEVTLGSSGP